MAANKELPPTVNSCASVMEQTNSQQLSSGILSLINPSIENLDTKVLKVKKSQDDLSMCIDAVSADLMLIASRMPNPHELDPYMKSIMNSKRRLNVVSSILHNCQERMRKLHHQVLRETERKRQQVNEQRAVNQSLLSQISASAATTPQPDGQTSSAAAAAPTEPAAVPPVDPAATAKDQPLQLTSSGQSDDIAEVSAKPADGTNLSEDEAGGGKTNENS